MEDELIYEISIRSRSLILAWLTWSMDTAEHQQARDKIIVDFTQDILTLIRKREKEWLDSISVERIHETLCLEFSPMCIDNTRLTKVAEAISKLIQGG
jgi:hypothetical protein